jgi:hypothetical protein
LGRADEKRDRQRSVPSGDEEFYGIHEMEGITEFGCVYGVE